ncbi:MAG: carboxypeptidase regulatory-like domain-containing protein, partial [Terriglobia bacterium]
MISKRCRPLFRYELFGFAILSLSLLACFPLYSQVTGGMLSGTVTDPSGAVVPGAKIIVTNTATGVSRKATTNSAGLYTAPNLQPGSYQITASATGFATQVRPGVNMTVGGQQVLNLVMQVGVITQTVEITTAPPIVQLSTSEITHEVSATTVRELPLNGRDWTQLATLQPGVISMGSLQPGIGSGSGSARGNRGFGTQLSISGGRPEQNNYRIDGISVNDYDNSSPGDALGVALGVDSIQEFSVLSSNYSAAYGRTSGGVINAITRSGTNSFHGSAYEFLRNAALDSRNYFDKTQIPPFRRNQFGASGGGPIKKDKTFIFADYEGLRQSLGVTNVDTVPSANARNGIIVNSGGTISNITVNPSVAAFLPLWRLPNGPLLGQGNTGIYSFVSNQIATENFFTIRLDQHFSAKDSLSGVYRFDDSLVSLPDVLNDVLTGQKAADQSVSVE